MMGHSCCYQVAIVLEAGFSDICCQVYKAQLDKALMVDGEPKAQQKHWISHKIQDKVVPKLPVCIHATQSLMQGQRLQQEEILIIGQWMWPIENKLDTIQHLQKPSNLTSLDLKGHVLEDALV
jgi:hypothetical protein